MDEAKISGIMPAEFTFSGMCVVSPPTIRLPRIRFAYLDRDAALALVDEDDAAIVTIARTRRRARAMMPVPPANAWAIWPGSAPRCRRR